MSVVVACIAGWVTGAWWFDDMKQWYQYHWLRGEDEIAKQYWNKQIFVVIAYGVAAALGTFAISMICKSVVLWVWRGFRRDMGKPDKP